MKKAWPYFLTIGIIIAIVILMRRVKIIDIIDNLPSGPGEYKTRDLQEIKYIVVHHSASDGQGPADYANYHVSHHGWPGIGYHFVIQPDGAIYQTNHLETVSNHVRNNNTPSIGICLSGNLDEHDPTRQQERSLKKLIGWLKLRFMYSLTVHRHGEFVNTSCPGMLDIEKFR